MITARDLTSDALSENRTTSPVPSALRQKTLYRNNLKRVFDVTLLVLSAPVWLPIVLIGMILASVDGHTPFYRQARVGKDGRIFLIWKLRTMVMDADDKLQAYLEANPAARAEWDETQKLKNDPRITPAGRFLRKTSLDELPQLINVLMGDMSLVGPRPIMINQQELYNGVSYKTMFPGLTGLWQVSERNECTFEERAHYDNCYAEMLSFRTDVAILFRTVGVVLRGTGY